MRRVLIVGAGFLATRLAHGLAGDHADVVVASRHQPRATVPWLCLHADVRTSCAEVAGAVQPTHVILVHGPSDVDWCEAHPELAERAHATAARNVRATWPGAWHLLVSTDNVFSGNAHFAVESDSPHACNAYGRAKLAAERELDQDCDLIWRISLAYGWPAAGERKNFFSTCVRELRTGGVLRAPRDQWTTPVLVDDVVTMGVALVRLHLTGTLHLGGPTRISRFAWAQQIATAVGRDRRAVVGESRRESAYACRPRNACLRSERRAHLPELATPMHDVQQGIEHLMRIQGTYLRTTKEDPQWNQPTF